MEIKQISVIVFIDNYDNNYAYDIINLVMGKFITTDKTTRNQKVIIELLGVKIVINFMSVSCCFSRFCGLRPDYVVYYADRNYLTVELKDELVAMSQRGKLIMVNH